MSNIELRPSSGHRWIPCWGSPVLIKSLNIKSKTGYYADEGNAAHELGAWGLDNKLSTVEDRLGETMQMSEHEVEVDADMVRHVDGYIEAVQRAAHGHTLLIERKIDCRKVLGRDRSGTGDAIVIPKKTRNQQPLEIHDLKYGQGVEVFALRNYQELIYAGGFITSNPKLDYIQEIKLVIHQPRIKGAPDEWTVTRKQLLKFVERVKKAVVKAEKAKVGEGLIPGDSQCHFCEAKAECPALEKEVMDVFANIDEESGSIQVSDDMEKLSMDRAKVPLIEAWCGAVKGRVHDKLEMGEMVPDWKLVEGRKGHRNWDDSKEAEKLIAAFRVKREDMYKHELKSPAQIQKVLSERRFTKLKEAGLIVQNDGKPTVVPASDPREQIASESVFDDIS